MANGTSGAARRVESAADLLVGLNPEQAAVVQHDRGPLRVGAIAGSGKTSALVRRIGYLVMERGVDPERVLAVTFSKKASEEMNTRLARILGGRTRARVGTFHSLAAQFIREEMPQLAKWELGEGDAYKIAVKDAISGKGLRTQDGKLLVEGMRWDSADLTLVESFIGVCKARCILAGTPEAREFAEELHRRTPAGNRNPTLMCEAYVRAEQIRRARRFYTFDDMLLEMWSALSADAVVRSRWATRWDYLLQDEAQDESRVQREICRMLAEEHQNYMVVGDVGQAIYGWRGAGPEGLLDFENAWSGSRTILMERNYRCGLAIAEAANGVLRAMKPGTHLGMMIKAERDVLGVVECEQHEDADAEADAVVQRIRELNADGVRWKNVVVLFRTNAQSRAMEEAAISSSMPYQIVGGINFYERREVRDLLAYLRLAAGRGSFEDVRRCINAPFRFLGKEFVDVVERASGTKGSRDKRGSASERRDGGSVDWTRIVRGCLDQSFASGRSLQARQKTSAEEWCSVVDQMSARISAGRERAAAYNARAVGEQLDDSYVHEQELKDARMDSAALEAIHSSAPASIIEDILTMTDYVRFLTRDEGSESPENNRVSNVRELVRAARRFGTVDALLDYIEETVEAARRAKAGEEGVDRVTMMSVHRCVDPSTLVETVDGLQEIGEVASSGIIGTTIGPREYGNRVDFAERDMLRIRTRCGYEIKVTEDHGMMTWDGRAYVRRDAEKLAVGDYLRLKIGAAVEPSVPAQLPFALVVDVRAVRYRTPTVVTEEVAEFLGLMVADGTVYHGGFRLKKRHADVRDRFARLAESLFGCDVKCDGEEPDFVAEVSSTFLAAWLLSVGGMGPCAKAVPQQVMRSTTKIQAVFLRGLFEDGTVNLDADGEPDHVSWSTVYPRMAEIVQTMLLRIGIVSSRFKVLDSWRVAVYENDLPAFRDRVGFVSSMKNERIRALAPLRRTNAVVPVDPEWVRANAPAEPFWHRVNGIQRGRVSRLVARSWGMADELSFHHDTIVSIERERGPAVCVEVPGHGRFVQNGFDGCNSKGMEYRAVFLIGANEGILPHRRCDDENEERRLFYVAVTRAKDLLSITCTRVSSNAGKAGELAPSRFIAEAGLTVGAVSPRGDTSGDDPSDYGAELGLGGTEVAS